MAAHGLWQNPNWRRMTVACLVLVTGGVIFIGSRIVVQAGQVQRQREEALQREAAEMARQLAIERARLEELRGTLPPVEVGSDAAVPALVPGSPPMGAAGPAVSDGDPFSAMPPGAVGGEIPSAGPGSIAGPVPDGSSPPGIPSGLGSSGGAPPMPAGPVGSSGAPPMMGMPRPATSAPRRMTPKEVAQLPEGAALPADPATEAKPEQPAKPEPQAKPEQPAKPESKETPAKETPPTESPAEKAKPADPQDGGTAPAEPDTELVAVGDILGDVVSVEFDGVPLREVLEHLAHIRKFEVVLHQSLVRDAAALDQPVTLKSRQLSLEQVLDQTLLPSDLEWNLEGPVLLVGMAGDMDSRMETHAYDVHELLDREEASELIETIEQTVQPDSWMAVGGSGQIKVFGQQLIVRQTQRAHRELEMFIANVKEQAAAADEKQAQNPDKAKRLVTAVYTVEEKSAAELRNAVTMLVGPSCWEEDNVVITVVGSKLLVRQTPAVQREVARLLKKIEVGPSPGPFGSPIPQTGGGGFGGGLGRPVGGGGGGFFQFGANESQPLEKKADSNSNVPGNAPRSSVEPVGRKADAAQSSKTEETPVVSIEDVLGDVVPVDFDGTSIRDVLVSLARQKKFEVIYNRKAAVLDQSITLKSRQMTIEEILDEMLPPCDLEWNVKGSVLLVGSVEEMDVKLERRNYDVSKLLENVDSNTLIKVVTQTISPGDWQEVGGSSSVKCLDTQLVVYATQRTHREVKRFLAEAEVKRDASLDNGKRDPEELVLQVYRVPAENPEKLETMVRNLFEVDFRDRVNTALFTFEGRLIVRQTRRVQREIGRLLELLRDPSAKNISCGGCWKGDGQFFTTTK